MRIAKGLLVVLVLVASLPAIAESEGQQLHDQRCLACHSTEVYTRDNRMIQSASGLKTQVERCAKGAAKVDWTPEQIAAVTQYLENNFYHF
jgi:mono/diheme cytochrome c family protein